MSGLGLEDRYVAVMKATSIRRRAAAVAGQRGAGADRRWQRRRPAVGTGDVALCEPAAAFRRTGR